MSYLKWFNILGGFGILLFSLRYLNIIIGGIVSRRFRSLVNRILSTQFRCFISSFFGTLGVQASSITVIGAMGLLSNSIINIEQGFFVILGASLGTAVKSWIFNINIYDYSLLFIGISSIALVFTKKLLIKEGFQLLLALGFAFLSFNIMAEVLPSISGSDYFKNFITTYQADSLQNQFAGVLIGFLIATLIQSSSAFIFLVTALGASNLISFEAGTSLILGANIGTTTTPLLVSLEYGNNVKKLSLSYLIMKSIGVFITLFFFPYFLIFCDKIASFLFFMPSVSTKLLTSHTVFNAINCVWWTFFHPFLFKFLDAFIKDDVPQSKSLPSSIRKMISSNHKLAIEEIECQITKLENVTKNLTDYCIELMMIKDIDKEKKSGFLTIKKDFENLKSTVYEIILQLNKFNEGVIAKDYNSNSFHFISNCSDLYYQSLSYSMHLEQGIFIDYYLFPQNMRDYFESFETHFNNLWLSVLLNKSTKESFENINIILGKIEDEYFTIIAQKNDFTIDHLEWLYESINFLKKMIAGLMNIKKSINLVKLKDFEV